ncbi:helix-turn-helix domain-containing protein [Patescibacteria group bacterium]|nr:helix-turn-helix domain-containing protein [Patescibacteria group bacterium]MCL5797951.1 helix-turn-helix domain-containing protein [Patescibacteria group bacterium]
MRGSTARALKILGKKIQKLRKQKDFTQEEFAARLGISRVYMGYIEQGRESPSLKLLMKIAGKLDVKIENLFHR